MSFEESLAAFHSFKAPTLDVDVMKSPDTLSIHWSDDIPVVYLSNFIVGEVEFNGYKLILPFE